MNSILTKELESLKQLQVKLTEVRTKLELKKQSYRKTNSWRSMSEMSKKRWAKK